MIGAAQKLVNLVWYGSKALTAMRHPAQAPFLLGRLARTRYDYRREVGDGLDASVVTAPVQWIQRALPEARLAVRRRGRDGNMDEIDGHPLTALVGRPNLHYGDIALWSGTLFSYLVAGNAYWLKVRNGGRRVAELWWTPHWTISPRFPSDGTEFLTGYRYRPGGGVVIDLPPEDVVHFRHGLDPNNPRLGLSPLQGVIREIFMDLEASNFVASLLRNMGVPGLVLSPEGGAMAAPEDVEALKTWLKEAFTGDRRGEPLVMGAPTKVQEYGFEPQKMDLSSARDVAEERVCACLGIPAAVVGFGAGLQQTKVGATMNELRRLAWLNGVLPVARALADELTRSLLPDLDGRDGDAVVFDTDDVTALGEDKEAAARRWSIAVSGGWATVAEAREALGLETDDSQRIFLRPFSAVAVPEGEIAPPAPEPQPAPEMRFLPAPLLKLTAKADRAEPSDAQRAYADRLVADERRLASSFEAPLTAFFRQLGHAAGPAARPLLAAEEASAAAEAGRKQDDDLVGRMLEQLELPLHEATFRRIYEAQYLEVAQSVAAAGELIGLGTSLPDPVARAVVAAGGRRAGLVDLTQQSRRALFDALAEGRAAGEGAEQLTARIVAHIEGGPWQTAETRARVIARTETRYGQQFSTLARAQAAGVARFMVLDGRFGPPRSTPSHIARNGMIVDAAAAARLNDAEHPNGTLQLVPHFEETENA